MTTRPSRPLRAARARLHAPAGAAPAPGPSGTGPTAATWSRHLPSPPGPGSRGLPQGRARWEGCRRPGRPAQSPTAPWRPRVGRGGRHGPAAPWGAAPPSAARPAGAPSQGPADNGARTAGLLPASCPPHAPRKPCRHCPAGAPERDGALLGPVRGAAARRHRRCGGRERAAAGRREPERPALPGPFPVPERGHSPPRAAAVGKAGGRRCRRRPAGPEGVKRKGRAGPSHSLAGRFVSSRRRRRGAEQAAPARPPQGALRRRRARGAAPQPSSGGTHDAQHVIRRASKWPPPGPRRATAPSGFGQWDEAFSSGSRGAAVAVKLARGRGRPGVAEAAAHPSSWLRQPVLRSALGGGRSGTRTLCRPGRVGGSGPQHVERVGAAELRGVLSCVGGFDGCCICLFLKICVFVV